MNEPENPIPLSSLVLSRLLSRGSKGETPAGIRKVLQPLAWRAGGKAELLRDVEEQIARLQEEDLLERVSSQGSTCVLTPAGREKACAFLGLDRIPHRITWTTVRDTYLASRALGVDPSYLKKRGLDGVRAVVLARELDLPWRPSSTLTSVLDGYLARAFELRSRPQYALRPALVARQVTLEAEPGPVQPQTFDTDRFARDVLVAAEQCRTGWFGDGKVFISHVWPVYAERFRSGIQDLEAFKRHLIEAHRADLLTLSGADLVEAMDPEDVSASETRYLNATFHFVRCRRKA